MGIFNSNGSLSAPLHSATPGQIDWTKQASYTTASGPAAAKPVPQSNVSFGTIAHSFLGGLAHAVTHPVETAEGVGKGLVDSSVNAAKTGASFLVNAPKGVYHLGAAGIDAMKGDKKAAMQHIDQLNKDYANSYVGKTYGSKFAGDTNGLGNAGSFALDAGGLKGAGGLIKGAAKEVVKDGLVKTVAKTAGKGAAEGAGFGGAYGATEAAKQNDLSAGNLTRNVAAGAATGAVAGGALGGGAAAVKGSVEKQLNGAIDKWVGLRTQVAIAHHIKPDSEGAGSNMLPAGEKQLALPAGQRAAEPAGLPANATATGPIKTTAGPNGGVTGEFNEVSPATAGRITRLNQIVHNYQVQGRSADDVTHLGTLAAMRTNAAGVVDHIAADRAEMLMGIHKDTGGVDTLKNDGGTGSPTYSRASRNDSFYRQFYETHGHAPDKAAWTEEAHLQLATGKDEQAQHYQQALELAQNSDSAYREHEAKVTGPTSDIHSRGVSGEQAGRAKEELAKTQAQAGKERLGEQNVAEPKTPDATVEHLEQHLHNIRAGHAVGSEVVALNDLIEHPGVSNEAKVSYIEQRDALKPSAKREAKEAAAGDTSTASRSGAKPIETPAPAEAVTHQPTDTPATAARKAKAQAAAESLIQPKRSPVYADDFTQAKEKPAAKPVPSTAEQRDTGNVDDYEKNLLKSQDKARGDTGLLARAKDKLAGVKADLVDSNAPIEDRLAAHEKTTGTKIDPTKDVRLQISRSKRSDSISDEFMHDNGLAAAIQNAPDTNKLSQYLQAKHAVDLEANGVTTGRNLVMDKKLVDERAKEYEPFAKKVVAYGQKLLDEAVDSGLINRDAAQELKLKYPNYVPFERIFADGELSKPGGTHSGGPASLSKQSIVQKIKGSNRAIEDPLATLVNRTRDVFDQGERNRAAQMLTDPELIKNGNPFGLRQLSSAETIGNRHTISVLRDGRKETYETQYPAVAEAAKSLNKQQLGLVGQILNFPVRVLKIGATGINPVFIAKNLVKDQASAFINSNRGLRTSIANPNNFLRALGSAIKHDDLYHEAKRAGALGTSFDISRNAPKQTVGKIRAEKNVGTKIAYTVTHPKELLRAVEDIVARSEEATRLQQYRGTREALKGSMPIEQAQLLAAKQAREATVDFFRAGNYGQVLNSVLPYLNAGIQGSRTLLRSLKERPAETAAKLAITAFMPTAITTAWNLSDPKRREAYNDIKDYEKDGNLIIVPPNPTKDANGKWNVIKIPVSQEVANLNSIVRQGVEVAAGDKKVDFGKIASDIVGTTTSLNVGSGREIVSQFTPQAIKPVIEATTNKNLYTGNPIVPESMKDLPADQQAFKGTSATARKVGGVLGVSPLQVDNAVGTVGAGVAKQLENASDELLVKTGAAPKEQVGGQNVGQALKDSFTAASGGASDKPIKTLTTKQTSDAVKAAGGSSLLAMQVLRLSGDQSDKKFFNAHPELDPTSKTFSGFNFRGTKQESAGIREGFDTAKANGQSLAYMQSIKASGSSYFDKFFKSNPNLDPTSNQYDGTGSKQATQAKNEQKYQAKQARYNSSKYAKAKGGRAVKTTIKGGRGLTRPVSATKIKKLGATSLLRAKKVKIKP